MLEYILLGIVQGLTEWLPISSSGHLVIFEQLFNIKVDLFFNIALHLGTLLVLLLFFWKDIMKLSRKYMIYIGAGSIITGVVGFVFYDVLKSFLRACLPSAWD